MTAASAAARPREFPSQAGKQGGKRRASQATRRPCSWPWGYTDALGQHDLPTGAPEDHSQEGDPGEAGATLPPQLPLG